MYGYNAEPPIAIPIYTVLPYCVINRNVGKYRTIDHNCVRTVGGFAVVDSVRGSGILQKQCCCMRETGDRTEKASCQSVRATMKAEEKLALPTIDKFDFSKPEWTSSIVEAGLDHRRCRSYPVTRAAREILRESLNSRLIN